MLQNSNRNMGSAFLALDINSCRLVTAPVIKPNFPAADSSGGNVPKMVSSRTKQGRKLHRPPTPSQSSSSSSSSLEWSDSSSISSEGSSSPPPQPSPPPPPLKTEKKTLKKTVQGGGPGHATTTKGRNPFLNSILTNGNPFSIVKQRLPRSGNPFAPGV